MRLVLLSIVSLLLLAAPSAAGEIRLSAAASLRDAINEISAAFAAARPQTAVRSNFGGSGTLAKQIAQGAPADIFISASRPWIEFLVGEGRLAAESVRDLAGNVLVFVGRPGAEAAAVADLSDLTRIAIGSPQSVPAGHYAREALTRAGIYRQLAAENRLVIAKDVRQALVYADRGEVDGAFVYRTDALLATNAVILFQVPAGLHSPIIYPVALTASGAENEEAVAFHRFLQGAEAKEILKKYGFKEGE